MISSLFTFIEAVALGGAKLSVEHREVISHEIDRAVREIVRAEIEADRERRRQESGE